MKVVQNFNRFLGRHVNQFLLLRFDRLKDRQVYYCRCQCGNEAWYGVYDILKGTITSCGCQPEPTNRPYLKKLDELWRALKNRCDSPNYKGYANYGGRSITYAEDWQIFANFYNDMAGTYQPGLQLDRKDTDGNYCKENCRWVTPQENIWNRRHTSQKASIYIGVYPGKVEGTYLAKIKVNNKSVHLGTYRIEREAALAYDAKCIELRGNLARLNQDLFPDDFTKVIDLSSQPTLGQLAA